ncbi:M23 family metallopeptidase [Pseudobdellovibrio exovorus]|uniref:M23ase beta-sheet core domain-containing protein n=1 Tax=Pseudobdellovibrio exovorus JSS TaxID=1184267 RepID=M4VF55_9BACT|nr:M23 family metallopeptidase [Pseudobdellovibrio exovorus]AGH96681.1 hypothetical protein A11Q_2465 [Pseudobdellovibrio exovorus JSS]
MKKRWLIISSFILLLLSTSGFISYFIYPSAFWNFRIQYLLKDCQYSSSPCDKNEYCIQFNPKQGKCFPKSNLSPEIIFPRDLNTPTVCSQGNLTGENRTHSYLNTGYAVDLSTPPTHKNAEIRAVFNGKIMTHVGCDNKDGENFNNDTCGQGFGNWIALFDDSSNLIAFYAHLRSHNVKSGEVVKVGQVIGEEGKTGAAGHRHLHFSIHNNLFKITPDDMKKHGAWLPPSIPFRVKVIGSDGKPVEKSVDELPCEDSNDLSRPPFYGAE